MKLNQLTLIMALSSAALFSCNNDKSSETTTTADTVATVTTPVTTVADQAPTSGTATVITVDQVPEPVRTSFTTKYPKLEKVEWYTYTPAADDDLVMDDKYYYVRYNNNGADYTSWYDNRGEWVKTSTVIPGPKSLPDAVNKYINANYEGYTIEEIQKENDKDMDMYEIKLNKGESKVKIKILPNGEIFKRKTR